MLFSFSHWQNNSSQTVQYTVKHYTSKFFIWFSILPEPDRKKIWECRKKFLIRIQKTLHLNIFPARQGFWRAGGFSRIYSGIGPAAAGSAPNAALFFCTYDTAKRTARERFGVAEGPQLHMAAASLGEVVACVGQMHKVII